MASSHRSPPGLDATTLTSRTAALTSLASGLEAQLSGADAAVSRMLAATEGLRRAEFALLAERRFRDS